MSNKFHLGENFYLPESIITETIAVLGIRGSGKTTTAKDIVEEALENKRQVAIIDPTDSWWGVKSGFKIIVFGGAHGDMPLDEGSGKLIADFVVDYGVSVILSLRHLRKAAQKRLITAFNEQLYFRKGEVSKRTPVLVVIDECDTFIPQKVMGEDARSVGAVEDLVRRGRNAGIGVALISQRAASINKDVLTQLTVLIAHKHTSPQDRKALNEWILGHDTEDRAKVFLDSLAALPIGTAWVWAPGLGVFERVRIRKSSTFDSSATPKLGETTRSPKTLKSVDLAKLKIQMKEAIEQHEQNDPSKLKAKISALQTELKKKAVPVVDKSSELKLANICLKAWEKCFANLSNLIEDFSTRAEQEIARVEKESAPSVGKYMTIGLKETKKHVDSVPSKAKLKIESSNGTRPLLVDKRLSSGVKRLLTVLAQANEPLPVARLALRAGMSQNSTLRNYLSQARVAGFIEGSGQNIELTEDGHEALGHVDPVPVDRLELLKYWQSRVNSKQEQILSMLFAYPSLPAQEVAAAVEMRMNSTWRNYISQLRTLGLIEGSKVLSLSKEFGE